MNIYPDNTGDVKAMARLILRLFKISLTLDVEQHYDHMQIHKATLHILGYSTTEALRKQGDYSYYHYFHYVKCLRCDTVHLNHTLRDYPVMQHCMKCTGANVKSISRIKYNPLLSWSALVNVSVEVAAEINNLLNIEYQKQNKKL